MVCNKCLEDTRVFTLVKRESDERIATLIKGKGSCGFGLGFDNTRGSSRHFVASVHPDSAASKAGVIKNE